VETTERRLEGGKRADGQGERADGTEGSPKKGSEERTGRQKKQKETTVDIKHKNGESH